jgi:hypothetical protein
MDYIDISDFKKAVFEETQGLEIKYDGNNIYFTKQKTGYGEKIFFKCPECGSKRTKLYFYKDNFICRKCHPSNIYKQIQNTTKGGYDYISYRMKQFAASRDIIIKKFPFHYLDYAFEKPKYKHMDKWVENINILQALENMRFQTIAYNKKWDAETVKSVIDGKNTCLYIYELYEIQKYIIKWDLGVDRLSF